MPTYARKDLIVQGACRTCPARLRKTIFWLEFSGILVSYGLIASQNPGKFHLKSCFPRLHASSPTGSKVQTVWYMLFRVVSTVHGCVGTTRTPAKISTTVGNGHGSVPKSLWFIVPSRFWLTL